MTASVLAAARRAELREVRVPAPAADEILVRVEGCGICGSNVPVWEGRPWFTYPLEPGAPGHETWGVVERVGSQVSAFRAGDRVATLSDHGFAEFDVTQASRAVALPASFAAAPFPGEPLGCAMNIARRSAFPSVENVAIVGVGFLGALLVVLAKRAGAQVVAISRRKFARDVAQRFGADAVFDWNESGHAAESVSSRGGFDCVVECVGSQEALDCATQLARERARLVIAGYHQDGPRHVNMQLWNWRGLDVINAHERDPQVCRDGMRAAVKAITSGWLDPTPLYTHFFSLDQLGQAFEMLRARPVGFMKALVTP
jgi:2-desacetyl-2-hydroxyethyl bacteriochlorophyllide A dehydrogenase